MCTHTSYETFPEIIEASSAIRKMNKYRMVGVSFLQIAEALSSIPIMRKNQFSEMFSRKTNMLDASKHLKP